MLNRLINPMNFLLFFALIVFAGCQEDETTTESVTEVLFTEISSENFSQRTDYDLKKQLVVLSNQSDFDLLYPLFVAEETPVVDFEEYLVLALLMGSQSTGGYNIQVDVIYEQDNYIEVNVVSSLPGSNCVTTEALTDPYQFVKIPFTDKEVIFLESVVISSCDLP